MLYLIGYIGDAWEEPPGAVDMREEKSGWRAVRQVLPPINHVEFASTEAGGQALPGYPACRYGARGGGRTSAYLRQMLRNFCPFGVIGPFWEQISLLIQAASAAADGKQTRPCLPHTLKIRKR